jgi:hypothetical protein
LQKLKHVSKGMLRRSLTFCCCVKWKVMSDGVVWSGVVWCGVV